jgi:hypothetical protein
MWSRCCTVVWLLLLLWISCVNGGNGKRKVTNTRGMPTSPSLWSHDNWKDADVGSYLTDLHDSSTATNGQRAVLDVMKVIHANQHPPKETCKSTRLLILHTKTETLEGLYGGIMKQVAMGLSAAMHSNRTLIWGMPDGQFLFDSTREIWAGKRRSNIAVGPTVVNCPDDKYSLGGSYDCFFRELSSCSLSDIDKWEMQSFVDNPFNDTERVKFFPIGLSAVASITMFHPPYGLYDHILKTYTASKMSEFSLLFKENGAHLWSAAISAYTFRLKTELTDSFKSRFGRFSHRIREGPLWGIHIRHGDVKSMHQFIREKRVFSIGSFFVVARDMSHDLRSTPSHLFVSTDSVKANDLSDMFQRFNDGADAYELDDDDYDQHSEFVTSKHSEWFGIGRNPQLFTVTNADRYRTEHGFVVAATEGCVDNGRDRKVCEIPMQFPVDVAPDLYGGTEDVMSISRPMRMMRMMLEAIEDVYLLAQSDAIICQGSSHFSTLAIMLMWARTGVHNVERSVKYLDYDSMVSGDSPCAFLQGTNLWNASYVGPGIDRWRIHTHRFISGLPSIEVRSDKQRDIGVNYWSDEMLMRIENQVPQLPDELFYKEARQWLGDSNRNMRFPGQCVEARALVRSYDLDLILSTTNLGAEHYQATHLVEAVRCWGIAHVAALRFMHRNASVLGNVAQVTMGNIRAVSRDAANYTRWRQITASQGTGSSRDTHSSSFRPNRQGKDRTDSSTRKDHEENHDANTQSSELSAKVPKLLAGRKSESLELDRLFRRLEKLRLEAQILKLEAMELMEDVGFLN